MTEEEKLEEKAREKARAYNTEYAEDCDFRDMISRPKDFIDGAIERMYLLLKEKHYRDGYLAGLKAGKPKWHKVADGKLSELDEKVWVIRSADDDIPMVARRHIYTSYGRTEWEWECYWGNGFDLKQNEVFAWCEIPKYTEE